MIEDTHRHRQDANESALRLAFLLTIIVLVVETGGGLLAHSLALLSDAGHVFTDLVALGIAWFARAQAHRPSDPRRTYGYHRTGILAALANAVALILIVIGIVYEAVGRLQHPQAVAPWILFPAAALGIAVNLYIGSALRREGAVDLNVRAAVLHVFADVGASLAVIVAGAAILLTGWYQADALISLAIAVLIARGAWDVLRETVDILMEAAPTDLNVPQMVRDMMRVPAVRDVHDLHVWSIAGGMPVLTAHVQVAEDCTLTACEEILVALNQLLTRKYGMAHTTIQFECVGCDPNHLYCKLQPGLDSARGGSRETAERL